MTTLRSIVKRAYRESGILQKGLVPDADQLEEGLENLVALYSDVLGNEAGNPLKDFNYGTHEVALSHAFEEGKEIKAFLDSAPLPSNVRLLVNENTAQEVFLDPNPYDGQMFGIIDVARTFNTSNFTINANTRSIDGAKTKVLSTEGTNAIWMYRADLGEWRQVTQLDENSESPFPSEFDDLFVLRLAFRLHPRYLVETRGETLARLQEMKKKFRARYSVPSEKGLDWSLSSIGPRRYRKLFGQPSSDSFNFN